MLIGTDKESYMYRSDHQQVIENQEILINAYRA